MKISLNKIPIIILIGFLNVLSAHSQSLEFVEAPLPSYSANLDSNIDIYITAQIKNVSQKDLNIKIKTEVISLPFGHSYDVCWNELCSPPTRENWLNSTVYTLAAGSVSPSNLFYSHYYAFDQGGNLSEGSGTIKYIFYDTENPDDNLSFEVTFSFTQSSVFEAISSSNLKVEFSDNKILRIMAENELSSPYFITIYSLLGAKVQEAQFSDYFETDFSNFGNQVFLYQITQGGKIVGSGKIE